MMHKITIEKAMSIKLYSSEEEYEEVVLQWDDFELLQAAMLEQQLHGFAEVYGEGEVPGE